MATRGTHTPQTWVNGAAPGISAAELQRIDDAIEALDSAWSGASGENLTVPGALSVADLSVSGSVTSALTVAAALTTQGVSPDGDATRQLGASGASWSRVYTASIYDNGGVLRWDTDGNLSPGGYLQMGGNPIHGVAAGELRLWGGAGDGAMVLLFDAAHATYPDRAFFDAARHTWRTEATVELMRLTSATGLEVARNVIPIGSNSYDLGGSGAAWKDLWLAGNLYLGAEGNDYIAYDAVNEWWQFFRQATEVLRFGDGGAISVSKPFGCDVYHSTSQSLTNGAWTNLSMNSERYDPYGNCANGVYTIPTAGFYLFGASVRIDSIPTDFRIGVLHSTGASYEAKERYDGTTLGGDYISMSGARWCGAGETLRPRAYVNAASTATYNNTARFWVVRVS